MAKKSAVKNKPTPPDPEERLLGVIFGKEERWRYPDEHLKYIAKRCRDVLEHDKKRPKKTSSGSELSYLDNVFIDNELKDDVVVRVSIPDLIESRQPSYPGVILFGRLEQAKHTF